jgi:hypothetical protein
MKPRSLVAAAVLLAALSAGVWWAKKHPQSASSTTASNTVKLVNIPADQLQQIDIKKNDGTGIDLKRTNGKWQIIAPATVSADQDAVSGLTSALAPLNADSVVAENGSAGSQYGLNNPSLTVTLNLKNGKKDTVKFGDDAPAGSLVYAKADSDPKIYAVSSSVKSSFDKSVNDLRDKRLLTFNSEKLTSIELTTKKGDLTFGKNNQGDWQIVKPGPYRADSFQVEELVRKLGDARMDLTGAAADEKKDAALFAAGQPVATVKVTDAGGPQSLDVRKNKDDYYAKSSVVAGMYKVSSDLGSSVDKTLADFRNHKIFDFGFSDPTKLEFRNGSSDTTYTKSGQDWKSNGKTMDASSVQAVIDQLRDLSATSFPTTGFANPAIDITVTSNDGKRVEKASFTKSGANYIAKREGEPSLYELTGKSVDDALKAFAGIKPQAAKAKQNSK